MSWRIQRGPVTPATMLCVLNAGDSHRPNPMRQRRKKGDLTLRQRELLLAYGVMDDRQHMQPPKGKDMSACMRATHLRRETIIGFYRRRNSYATVRHRPPREMLGGLDRRVPGVHGDMPAPCELLCQDDVQVLAEDLVPMVFRVAKPLQSTDDADGLGPQKSLSFDFPVDKDSWPPKPGPIPGANLQKHRRNRLTKRACEVLQKLVDGSKAALAAHLQIMGATTTAKTLRAMERPTRMFMNGYRAGMGMRSHHDQQAWYGAVSVQLAGQLPQAACMAAFVATRACAPVR